MKLAQLVIRDYRMFRRLELDLTYREGHPKAGQALDKVCFIGANGTGKTTLLKFVHGILSAFKTENTYGYSLPFLNDTTISFTKYDNESNTIRIDYSKNIHIANSINKDEFHIISNLGLKNFSGIKNSTSSKLALNYKINNKNKTILFDFLNEKIPLLLSVNNDLLIFCSSDINLNAKELVNNIAKANLNSAFSYFKNKIATQHEISIETVTHFWNLLIYYTKKREEEFLETLRLPENKKRYIEEVEKEFDQTHPKILKDLAKLWDKILDKAGLYFDYESAKVPIQMNENLVAHIKLKSTKETIPYDELSSGIRYFMFRLGHIFSLYFNREIERGFLLVDEPENSLFPDFLYDLVDTYRDVTKDVRGQQNTQMFMATHSPIIAAQFHPDERFILEFDNEGYVTARRGVAPEGDDPNDLLIKDFGVHSLMGKKGVEQWERYIELKTLAKIETDIEKKHLLMDEMARIGLDYGFSSKSKT